MFPYSSLFSLLFPLPPFFSYVTFPTKKEMNPKTVVKIKETYPISFSIIIIIIIFKYIYIYILNVLSSFGKLNMEMVKK